MPAMASDRWTRSNAGAIICTHSWLTRWGAPADNNLPVIAAVAPILLNNSAVLPLVRLLANHPAMPGLAVPSESLTQRLFGKR